MTKNKSLEELTHIDDIKEIIESVKDKSQDLKDKSDKLEKSISKYTKENPWKAIGFSVLAGALISKILF